jgi:menaquinone-dependent protoporphyrinogen oxidase
VVRPAHEVGRLDGYDAFVLGSAVYMGHWLEAARDLVHRNAETLSGRPVWLFSSGPIGDPPKPDEQPVDVGEAIATTRAREHRLFAGKLDRHRLGFAERAMVLALRAPEGDFRDWVTIETWAARIADALRAGQ